MQYPKRNDTRKVTVCRRALIVLLFYRRHLVLWLVYWPGPCLNTVENTCTGLGFARNIRFLGRYTELRAEANKVRIYHTLTSGILKSRHSQSLRNPADLELKKP